MGITAALDMSTLLADLSTACASRDHCQTTHLREQALDTANHIPSRKLEKSVKPVMTD
jgi:hypothetical protein